jgi:hypothetical protein
VSEFRIFCMGLFIGTVLFGAADAYGQIQPHTRIEGDLSLLTTGIICGAWAVIIFGPRK